MLLRISRREMSNSLKLELSFSTFCGYFFSLQSFAIYLWRVVSTDDRAKHVVNEEPQGVARPPGSAPVGQVPDGSQHLLQGAVVRERNAHPGVGEAGEAGESQTIRT